MILVDSFAQAYRWGAEACLSLTMPQILMLNHAAHVNRLRVERKVDHAKSHPSSTYEAVAAPIQAGEVVYNGKTLHELTGEEYAAYFRAW